jgi:hypothetical protein
MVEKLLSIEVVADGFNVQHYIQEFPTIDAEGIRVTWSIYTSFDPGESPSVESNDCRFGLLPSSGVTPLVEGPSNIRAFYDCLPTLMFGVHESGLVRTIPGRRISGMELVEGQIVFSFTNHETIALDGFPEDLAWCTVTLTGAESALAEIAMALMGIILINNQEPRPHCTKCGAILSVKGSADPDAPLTDKMLFCVDDLNGALNFYTMLSSQIDFKQPSDQFIPMAQPILDLIEGGVELTNDPNINDQRLHHEFLIIKARFLEKVEVFLDRIGDSQKILGQVRAFAEEACDDGLLTRIPGEPPSIQIKPRPKPGAARVVVQACADDGAPPAVPSLPRMAPPPPKPVAPAPPPELNLDDLESALGGLVDDTSEPSLPEPDPEPNLDEMESAFDDLMSDSSEPAQLKAPEAIAKPQPVTSVPVQGNSGLTFDLPDDIPVDAFSADLGSLMEEGFSEDAVVEGTVDSPSPEDGEVPAVAKRIYYVWNEDTQGWVEGTPDSPGPKYWWDDANQTWVPADEPEPVPCEAENIPSAAVDEPRLTKPVAGGLLFSESRGKTMGLFAGEAQAASSPGSPIGDGLLSALSKTDGSKKGGGPSPFGLFGGVVTKKKAEDATDSAPPHKPAEQNDVPTPKPRRGGERTKFCRMCGKPLTKCDCGFKME